MKSTARRRCFLCFLLGGVNRNLLTILAQTLEADNAVGLGKQRIIAADANVGAGVDVGAALADQDVAGQNELTISALGTKALGLGITAVFRNWPKAPVRAASTSKEREDTFG